MAADFVVVGLSHRTAPIELRERVALDAHDIAHTLGTLVSSSAGAEVALLSTCNRTEAYAITQRPAEFVQSVCGSLMAKAGTTQISHCIYTHQGLHAVQHAFRVAASLDSMVVGEPQILGQFKGALGLAQNAGTVGTLLGRWWDRALSVAKRVRNETQIAMGSVSVSSVACELAEKIFGSLQGKTVLLIGAGKMGESSAKKLISQGARLLIANRNHERALELANQLGAHAHPYENLNPLLENADVVISSTASTEFILTAEQMRAVVHARRYKPIFLIDIALPRNVDPSAAEVQNVFVYDLDDLQKAAQDNLSLRLEEAKHAETIVSAEAQDFSRWVDSLKLTDTIVALRAKVYAKLHHDLQKNLDHWKEGASDDPQALNVLCEKLVNRLLHDPVTQLKKATTETETKELIAAIHRLFQLDYPADAQESAESPTPLPPRSSS